MRVVLHLKIQSRKACGGYLRPMNAKRRGMALTLTMAVTFLSMMDVWGQTETRGSQPEVQFFGALKDMMMHSDISSKARLADHSGSAGMWGLGAVAGLQGEVFIEDGTPWVSRSEAGNPDAVVVDQEAEAEATLLVAARVAGWTPTKLPRKVKTQAELEDFLLKAAREAGFDVDAPFPFRLTGTFSEVQWHVVNWKEGDMEHTCEKHKMTGPHGVLAALQGEILGFHSLHHHRIFTHHSTNVHMHVKSASGDLVAHVDGLTLGKGTTLWLPGNGE